MLYSNLSVTVATVPCDTSHVQRKLLLHRLVTTGGLLPLRPCSRLLHTLYITNQEIRRRHCKNDIHTVEQELLTYRLQSHTNLCSILFGLSSYIQNHLKNFLDPSESQQYTNKQKQTIPSSTLIVLVSVQGSLNNHFFFLGTRFIAY